MSQKRALKINGQSHPAYKKGDVIFYGCLLALPLLQIAVFYFGVNVQSFFMAFQKYDSVNGVYLWDPSINWSRFSDDISQSGFWRMVLNSFVTYFLAVLAGTVLAVIFAYYIYKKRTFYNFFKFVLFLPSILPSILLVIMFKTFTSDALPAYLEFFFHDTAAKSVFLNSTLRYWVITLFSVWISFGAQVLVYTGAMDQISPEILEAGKIDGATPMKEFTSLVVPLIFPTIGTFLIAGVASIFTNQNNLFNFLGTSALPQEKTIGYYLYVLVYADSGAKSGYCYAAFLGLVCTLLVVPLAFGVRKLVERAEA
jgi:ABC-type sugar transport system permease subunit